MTKRPMMPFRFYRPEDEDALVKIFQAQDLPVYAPIPFNHETGRGDPAVAAVIVGENENGGAARALVARSDIEVSYFFNPNDPPLPRDLQRMSVAGEGALLQLSTELAKFKFPIYTTVRARVPKTMTEMIKFMEDQMGFVRETDEFVGLCKVIGR